MEPKRTNVDTEPHPPQQTGKYRLKPSEVYLKGSGRWRIYVEVTCKNGHTRLLPKHNAHAALCRQCSYESRSLGVPTKFKCPGSDPYSTVPLEERPHADGCPREDWLSQKRIKVARLYNTSLNETKKEYRFAECRRVVNQIRQQETLIRAFAAKKWFRSSQRRIKRFKKEMGFNPFDPFPRIRSPKQLSKYSKACRRLSHENPDDPDILWRLGLFVHIVNSSLAIKKCSFLYVALLFLPKLVVFDPHSFKPGNKASKGGRPGKNPERSKSLRLKYAKGWLKTKRVWQKTKKETKVLDRAWPDTAKGMCQLFGCGYFNAKGRWRQYFVLSSKPGPVYYHQPCYLRRGAPIRQRMKELADQHGVSDDTIYRRIKAGILPALIESEAPERRKQGRPIKKDNLRRYWSWYKRHKDGEGYGTIAKEPGPGSSKHLSRDNVVDGITWIEEHKPPRKLVSKQFHPQL
jgi:hypothetical protein